MASKKKEKISSLWKEFKAFISRGNVIDMAIGVVIGSAFTAIINSIVNGIFMPIISLAVPSGLDGIVTVLNSAEAMATSSTDPSNIVNYWGINYDKTLVNVINWGSFIDAVINFLIIALILFIILKVFTALNNKRKSLLAKKEEIKPVEEPKPSEDILLLREIRDSLKKEDTNKISENN